MVFTINLGSAVLCTGTNWVLGMYCELQTKFFCHWFMAALWSGLALNQWGKWGSVTLSIDWEYEASKKIVLSQRLIGIWEREYVREVYWNMASNIILPITVHVLTRRYYMRNKHLLINELMFNSSPPVWIHHPDIRLHKRAYIMCVKKRLNKILGFN